MPSPKQRAALSEDCPRCVLSTKSEAGVHDAGAGLFRKDVLEVGKTYNHQKAGWTLPVTAEFAKRLVDQVGLMVANGVDIPILKRHNWDDAPDPEEVLGYCKGLSADDSEVEATCKFSDDDCATLAKRVGRVSVGLVDEIQDSQGRSYGPALHHIALAPHPVVEGQEDFVPIAASRGQTAERVPVLTPEAATEVPAMSLDVKALCDLLGEDATEDNVLERVEKLKTAAGENKGLADKLAASKEEVTGLDAKVKALSKGNGEPPTLDPDVEAQLTEGADAGFGRLCEQGFITPAVRDRFLNEVVRSGEKPNAYALSRSVSGHAKPTAFLLVDILGENKPVELREQTGRQTRIAASRETPGEGEKHETDEGIEQRVKALGVAVK